METVEAARLRREAGLGNASRCVPLLNRSRRLPTASAVRSNLDFRTNWFALIRFMGVAHSARHLDFRTNCQASIPESTRPARRDDVMAMAMPTGARSAYKCRLAPGRRHDLISALMRRVSDPHYLHRVAFDVARRCSPSRAHHARLISALRGPISGGTDDSLSRKPNSRHG